MTDAATTSKPAEAGSIWDELKSMKTPERKQVNPAPKIGDKAPTSTKIPLSDGKATVILFLRHCGCPFAEKTFKTLTALSEQYKDVHFIAVSHSNADHTARWVPQVGGEWSTDVIVDEERDIYSQWGLDISSTWHVFNPWSLWSVYTLGRDENIFNKPTESGNRWQTSGAFGVGKDGKVKYEYVSKTAEDLPDLKAAAEAVGGTKSA